jgi:hypothetical protein
MPGPSIVLTPHLRQDDQFLYYRGEIVATVISYGPVCYVSSAGDDGKAVKGRADRPFKTLAGAYAEAVPGDCIQVVGGTYNEGNISATDKAAGIIFVQLAGGARVVATSWTINGAHLYVGGDGTATLAVASLKGSGDIRITALREVNGYIASGGLAEITRTMLVQGFVKGVAGTYFWQVDTYRQLATYQNENYSGRITARQVNLFECYTLSRPGAVVQVGFTGCRVRALAPLLTDCTGKDNFFVDTAFKMVNGSRLVDDQTNLEKRILYFFQCRIDSMTAPSLFKLAAPQDLSMSFSLYTAPAILDGPVSFSPTLNAIVQDTTYVLPL